MFHHETRRFQHRAVSFDGIESAVFYQIPESLFRHDWIDYVFDNAFRMFQRGLRQLKQEVVFTSHSLEIFK